MHNANMICGSIHYGNIFLENNVAIIGDLSMAEILDDDSSNKDVIYGIIPYIAPEIIQVPKYTNVSDIYSLGIIMWELMTCRRPFWNNNHNIDLIIKIYDCLRPPSIFKYKLYQIVDEF
ncbi:kinase-like domain-containing protein [Glomus cerebriforme]|uniref:non-specific serine/threonine protein kinase n=1 Tax=Glomus cerebriforme TaxID=658196 RepID=A0A397SEX6_9GLOM|nr:kinase-like domain-containing protein [Glomus cerebriforme]